MFVLVVLLVVVVLFFLFLSLLLLLLLLVVVVVVGHVGRTEEGQPSPKLLRLHMPFCWNAVFVMVLVVVAANVLVVVVVAIAQSFLHHTSHYRIMSSLSLLPVLAVLVVVAATGKMLRW